MKCGTILFDSKFQFPNGNIDYKLIVVLCELGSDYLVVQTTRQPGAKNRTNGCQIKDNPSNFYLPRGAAWFEDDTWILLNEVFEYNSVIFDSKWRDNVIQHRTVLSTDLTKQIFECALQSEDIEKYYLDFITKALENL